MMEVDRVLFYLWRKKKIPPEENLKIGEKMSQESFDSHKNKNQTTPKTGFLSEMITKYTTDPNAYAGEYKSCDTDEKNGR